MMIIMKMHIKRNMKNQTRNDARIIHEKEVSLLREEIRQPQKIEHFELISNIIHR